MKTEKQKTARETAPFFFAVEKSGNVSRRLAAAREADKIAAYDSQIDEYRAEAAPLPQISAPEHQDAVFLRLRVDGVVAHGGQVNERGQNRIGDRKRCEIALFAIQRQPEQNERDRSTDDALEKQQRPEARVLRKEHKTVKGGVPGHFPQETAASRILMYPVDQGRAALEPEERQLRAECKCKEKRDQKREEERGEQKSFARLCGYLHGVILPV